MEQPQPFRKKKRVSDKNLSLNNKIIDYGILVKRVDKLKTKSKK